MDSYDSEKICIFQHFSRSIRLTHFCTGPNVEFQIFAHFRDFCRFLQNFAENQMKTQFFRQNFDGIFPEFPEIADNQQSVLFLVFYAQIQKFAHVCSKKKIIINFSDILYFYSTPDRLRLRAHPQVCRGAAPLGKQRA